MSYHSAVYSKHNGSLEMIRLNSRSTVNLGSPACIVLGGGGSRGLAHLGALQACAEAQVPVGRLVGVSMGALMASLCAVSGKPKLAQKQFLSFIHSNSGQKLVAAVQAASAFSKTKQKSRWTDKLARTLKTQVAVSRAVRSQSLLSSSILRKLIDGLLPDIDIRDVSTPIQIVTFDLRSGHRVVLTEGSLRRAVRASMSIPGIFPAVRYGEQLLSDIGMYDSVPSNIPQCPGMLHSQHEIIIAVDVGLQLDREFECDTALDAMIRGQILAEFMIRQQSLSSADIVVRLNLTEAGNQWFDFSQPELLIENGYLAAHRELEKSSVRKSNLVH